MPGPYSQPLDMTDDDAAEAEADADIYHNSFNGYKDGLITALRAQIDRLREVQADLVTYIGQLEALTP